MAVVRRKSSSSKKGKSSSKKGSSDAGVDAASAAKQPMDEVALMLQLRQPTTHEFEFNGPPGALALVVLLPIVVLALNYSCGAHGLLAVSLQPPALRLPMWEGFASVELFTWRATALVLCWFAFQVVLHLVLPGEEARGVKLRDGTSLAYRLNGAAACAVSALCLAAGWWCGLMDLGRLADDVLPLATGSILLSFALSVLVYVNSFAPDGEGKPRMLAVGGNSGSVIYDFFIGRELNPRVLGGLLDLKFFCELRPGMIGWLVLNAAFAVRQYELFGNLSNSMMLVQVFQAVYVLDSLINERAILTTMDLTTDGFGFMLCFGVLSWVPFTYSLQAHFLRYYPLELSPLAFCAVVAVMMTGYWIFRASNSTKDLFRSSPTDPRVAHISFIETQRGTRLMTSGWWGAARHINYLGDWIIAWSWCLPTGFATPVTYFYVIYFAVLLIHRDRRDDHNCRNKYGADWDRYCAIVRWRIVPYLY